MNPLQLIPPKYRAGFYALYGLAGLIAICSAAYFGALSDATTPDWVLGLGGVIVALAPVFGSVATGNVSTAPSPVAVVGPAEVTPLEDEGDRRMSNIRDIDDEIEPDAELGECDH